MKVHLKVTGVDIGPYPCIYWTACGLIGTPTHGAVFHIDDVSCENCKRTREFTLRSKIDD